MPSEHFKAAAQELADILELDDHESVSSARLARSTDASKALKKQLGDLFTLPGKDEAVCAYFCAKYLPALCRAYKATPEDVLVTPYTQMFSILMDKGHFARFLRTHEGREMLNIQTARFAGPALPRELDEILNVVQIFNFLVVYAYHNNNGVPPVIPSEQSKTIQEKCEAYRHLCYTKLPDRQAEHTFQTLTSTQEFLEGKRSPQNSDMLGAVGLMLPLTRCGDEDSRCWRTGRVPGHACGRCQSVFYCGAEHQKSHWKIHKAWCVRPEWI